MSPRLACLFLVALVAGSVAARPAALNFKAPDETCNVCLTAVRVMSDLLCDREMENYVMNFAINDVCPAFGEQEDQCQQFTIALLPVAIEWLRATATPSTLCGAAGVCPQATLAAPDMHRARPRYSDTADCPLCKFVVRTTKTLLDGTGPVDTAEVKASAEQVCSKLPTELQGACLKMMSERGGVMALTMNKLGVDQVCAASGYCNAALMSAVPAALPVGVVQTLGAAQKLQAITGLGTTACDSCKMTVLEMHMLLDSPLIQQDILTYMKSMCGSLFPGQVDMCTSFVDLYAPMIFQQLDIYMQPDPICQGIHMCVPPATMTLKTLTGAVYQHAVGGMAKFITSKRAVM